ncbi:MAG: SDR family oxidoreductase [Gammaproteobacteria bacterium]|nr:SDR family oxidoreductase [Gammaproteobacteria bacterium]
MLANYNLTGKKVLVTGGASGIGLGTVEAFLRCGASVAINDLPGDKLDDMVRRLSAEGHSVISAAGNIGDADEAAGMVADAIAGLGGIDYLINNAATPGTSTPIPAGDFERQTESFWNLILNVNLLGPFRCTQAAATALKTSQGAIVNTASISAFGGGGSSSAYCAAKAGLVNLTREWARALAPDVRVNAIAPGMVDSDWMCRFEGSHLDWVDKIPLQRAGSPQDYAEAILFLAAGAGYVNGQTLTVDGGLTI